MVVPELALLKVQHKLVRSAAVELRQLPLGKAPEIFYPVDVALSPYKLVA